MKITSKRSGYLLALMLLGGMQVSANANVSLLSQNATDGEHVLLVQANATRPALPVQPTVTRHSHAGNILISEADWALVNRYFTEYTAFVRDAGQYLGQRTPAQTLGNAPQAPRLNPRSVLARDLPPNLAQSGNRFLSLTPADVTSLDNGLRTLGEFVTATGRRF